MVHQSVRVLRSRVIIFIAAVILACTCCAASFAVSGDDMIIISIDNCIADNDYMLLIVKPGTSASAIGESTILYANQLTASGSSIRATIVMPSFSACDVYAGGDFSNGAASPKKVASYTAARFPSQVTMIEEAAFENSAFTHIYLGDQVTSIGSRAFASCDALVYVYIPASVKQIDSSAFAGSNHVTIGCKAGSVAYEFAVQNGLSYVIVDS